LAGRAPAAPALRWITGCAQVHEINKKTATGSVLNNFMYESLITLFDSLVIDLSPKRQIFAGR
jgi:hypothetical protein